MPLDPIELRKVLHQIPELSFKEFGTTKLLYNNIVLLEGIKIHRPLETGLLVEYTVNDGEYLLFRADIDALPIKEETGISISSRNENMHACGHDVHMSILYGFLRFVVENKIDQNILFMFQPGEEEGAGAERFIGTGVLEDFKIKNAIALHVTDEFDKGVIAFTPGVLFASSCEVNVEFFGKSAHVAFPENGINAFDGLTTFLSEVKNLITENDRTIFGYGKVTSGTARNIIPGYAKLEATIRTLKRSSSESFYQKLVFLLDDIKEKTGIDYKIDQGALYAEVKVDPELFDYYRKILSPHFPFIDCGYKMTGEDFGFIAELYPSFMFWLGTRTTTKYGLHSSKFFPDESVISLGIEAFKRIINGVPRG